MCALLGPWMGFVDRTLDSPTPAGLADNPAILSQRPGSSGPLIPSQRRAAQVVDITSAPEGTARDPFARGVASPEPFHRHCRRCSARPGCAERRR